VGELYAEPSICIECHDDDYAFPRDDYGGAVLCRGCWLERMQEDCCCPNCGLYLVNDFGVQLGFPDSVHHKMTACPWVAL